MLEQPNSFVRGFIDTWEVLLGGWCRRSRSGYWGAGKIRAGFPEGGLPVMDVLLFPWWRCETGEKSGSLGSSGFGLEC